MWSPLRRLAWKTWKQAQAAQARFLETDAWSEVRAWAPGGHGRCPLWTLCSVGQGVDRKVTAQSSKVQGPGQCGLGCSCPREAPMPLHQPTCQHSSRRRQGQFFKSFSGPLGQTETLLKPLGSCSNGDTIYCARIVCQVLPDTLLHPGRRVLSLQSQG